MSIRSVLLLVTYHPGDQVQVTVQGWPCW